MAKKIMRCVGCKTFTMKTECCNAKTIESKPPKFTPEDKYAQYRQEVKQEAWKKEGLL